MKRLLIPTFLLAIISIAMATAPAADLNGHWRGKIMDQYDVHYEFKVDGTTLTGKMYSMEGTTQDIRDAKLDGNKISFVVDVMGGPIPMTGVLVDNTLTISFNVQGFDAVVALSKSDK